MLHLTISLLVDSDIKCYTAVSVVFVAMTVHPRRRSSLPMLSR